MIETAEATIQDITNGLERRLATIPDLRTYAVEPDKPNFPCAYPRIVDWTYDDAFHPPTTIWHFDVWVLVGLEPRFGRAQTDIHQYLSPSGMHSIKCAIDDDPSLEGMVSQARATGGGAYGRVDIAGVTALGASIRVEVFS
jgi:hypothetical protein